MKLIEVREPRASRKRAAPEPHPCAIDVSTLVQDPAAAAVKRARDDDPAEVDSTIVVSCEDGQSVQVTLKSSDSSGENRPVPNVSSAANEGAVAAVAASAAAIAAAVTALVTADAREDDEDDDDDDDDHDDDDHDDDDGDEAETQTEMCTCEKGPRATCPCPDGRGDVPSADADHDRPGGLFLDAKDVAACPCDSGPRVDCTCPEGLAYDPEQAGLRSPPVEKVEVQTLGKTRDLSMEAVIEEPFKVHSCKNCGYPIVAACACRNCFNCDYRLKDLAMVCPCGPSCGLCECSAEESDSRHL